MNSRSILRWVDATSCVGITVVAVLCMKLHPPSNYVRHAVWAVFGSWLLITLLAATVFFPRPYQSLLQHAAWHLEGVDFMWIAWLMTDRIAALIDKPSCTLSHSGALDVDSFLFLKLRGVIIRVAAGCFHFRILTETLLGQRNVSLAIQMIFAGTFLSPDLRKACSFLRAKGFYGSFSACASPPATWLKEVAVSRQLTMLTVNSIKLLN